jgi:hypothetical protein
MPLVYDLYLMATNVQVMHYLIRDELHGSCLQFPGLSPRRVGGICTPGLTAARGSRRPLGPAGPTASLPSCDGAGTHCH